MGVRMIPYAHFVDDNLYIIFGEVVLKTYA